jgi:flavorubredoxin
MAIDEIAPDIFRISTYVPEINLQFNQFVVRDDEPLLFHTGMKGMFPVVREELARIVEPARIRWIGFSHFESDECGALNEWLAVAPRAEAICSFVGAFVSVNDFAVRPARPMADGETLKTGKHSFRYLLTPHVPHCWEAGLLFEETSETLLCSDLFTHYGEVEPLTGSDIVGRFRKDLIAGQQSPFADAYPFTADTTATLGKLAALKPQTLAVMHGSSFTGDCAGALNDLSTVMREVLGGGAA